MCSLYFIFYPLRSAWIFREIINKWLVKTHILDRFLIIWSNFDLYQSLNRLPIWNSQNYSMFPLAFVARSLQGHWRGFISRNYVVWPIFFLMNVFIALKGTHFWFLIKRCKSKMSNLRLSIHLKFSVFEFTRNTLIYVFLKTQNLLMVQRMLHLNDI